jgi:hypothetical protein
VLRATIFYKNCAASRFVAFSAARAIFLLALAASLLCCFMTTLTDFSVIKHEFGQLGRALKLFGTTGSQD